MLEHVAVVADSVIDFVQVKVAALTRVVYQTMTEGRSAVPLAQEEVM